MRSAAGCIPCGLVARDFPNAKRRLTPPTLRFARCQRSVMTQNWCSDRIKTGNTIAAVNLGERHNMNSALSTVEQKVVVLMRQLPATAVQEVQDFVTFLAARHCGWIYGDSASLERAVELMASDPFLGREIDAVNEEFACAESDGLEET